MASRSYLINHLLRLCLIPIRETVWILAKSMMLAPSAPYLMFGFFKQSTSPLGLVAELLQLLTGKPLSGFAHRREDRSSVEVTFDNRGEVLNWLQTIERDGFVEVELTVASSGGKKKGVELLGNWKNIAPCGPTPIVTLSTSGTSFMGMLEGPPDRDGLVAYKRFVELCDKVSPTYAAITVEWELDSPAELMLDPRSYEGFQDFYLGDDLGGAILQKAISIFEGSYIQRIANGTYISSTRFVNPERIDLKNREARSCEMGAVIAKHFS